MNNQEKTEIKSFVNKILNQYYCENDVNFVITTFSPDITWSSEEGQFLDTYEEAVSFLQQFQDNLIECDLSDETYFIRKLGIDFYLCICTFKISPAKFLNNSIGVHRKIHFVLQREYQNLKCTYIHGLYPYQEESQTTYLDMKQKVIDIELQLKNKNQEVYTALEMQKQAYLKIKEQKDFLDSIYESIMCGILRYRIINDKFDFISMNQEALRIMGYQSEEECLLKGPNDFFERIHPEERHSILAKKDDLKKIGDNFSYEYRIQIPGKKLNWVYGTSELLMDSDGLPIIQRIMIDVTEKKQLELALEKEHERFRIAIENTPAVIFEYDIELDQYSSYGTLEENTEKHNVELVISDYLKEQLQNQVDEPFQKQFCALLSGKAGNELELRMAPYYGSSEWVWAKITTTVIYDKEENPIKIIGKIRNIQSEKEKDFALEKARYRDGLTGLYKKDVGIRMVKTYLSQKSPDETCGLMLLDMDDFEKINQEEGSVFADAILQDVADILRTETGPNDIQIRLGGDEFMLFVKNCTKDRAMVLGPRIASLVKNLFIKNEKEVPISVSIGMCVTQVVEEYSGLYRCAESTLKYVKENRKGEAACYLDISNKVGTILTQIYTEEHYINEIGKQSMNREEDLISFALELLGKSKNLDDAIFLLLARIGKTYQFDRVSILETNADYLSYRFTYQWAKNTADLQLGIDFYITKEEFEAAANMYDEEGLCSYNISQNISNISSCLHAAIWNHGIYAGSFSFEINQSNYQWSGEQCKLLKELVKIVPSFVMKARADAVSQAKTDFLSRMSHEIRTPMNAISGMTTIAKSVLNDKEKVLNCLNKIESANIYLLNLINDILDMSRIESGKVELNLNSLNLQSLFTNLENLLKPQALEKNLEFLFDNQYKENRIVLADELRLNQIFVNIIGNAIKFTEPFGKIITKMVPLSEDNTKVTLRFSVEDTGIGISEDAIGRIFNAFEQAKKDTVSQYGGTGLGLSISSRLVQMMGGNLNVKSELDKGSIFYFDLTFCYDTKKIKKAPEKIIENKKHFDFTGNKILLAEDNELNCEIATTILEMKGFCVETAQNGKEAVQLFCEREEYYYDAILMDIRMPILDGLEATKRIRTIGKADSRSIPIIAMTANAFDEDTKKSMESGMNGHLSKPIQVDKLFNVLYSCIIKKEKILLKSNKDCFNHSDE